MTEDLILTFDLGTTRLKVALFDMSGKLVSQVSRRNVDRGSGDRRWQEAESWWLSCVDATRELDRTGGVDLARVKGISLSGRAGAAVFVNAAGEVIYDPWSDSRHADQLRSLVGGGRRRQVAMYGAALLSKYLWLKANEPDLATRTAHLLYAKDFLLYRLTGETVTDPSSGPDGDWPDDMLNESDIDQCLLPRPALPWTVAGSLQAKAAELLGLEAGTPVAVGAHDGICANTGAGSVSPGQYAITLGTHAVVRAVTESTPDGALRFYGYPPDKHIIGGNALMAGRSLDWFLDNWFDAPEASRQQLFAELNQAAGRVPAGADGVVFLPFLAGRIAPERRPGARATFHGMSVTTSRTEMYRAVLEGASFALTAIFEQVVDWVGEPQRIGVTGSGVASDTWMQLLADLIMRPLEITDHASEGRGAAIFCAVAIGHYPSLADAVHAMVHTSRTFQPSPDGKERYTEVRSRWQALSDSTRPFDLPN